MVEGVGTMERKRRCMERMGRLLLECFVFVVICFTGSGAAGAGAVIKEVPSVVDPKAKYLFYMQGLAIERGGHRAKCYSYWGILREIAVSIRSERSDCWLMQTGFGEKDQRGREGAGDIQRRQA